MNKGLNDIFTFDKNYDTAEYVTELQDTINIQTIKKECRTSPTLLQ